jgi:outer membrane protein TolC
MLLLPILAVSTPAIGAQQTPDALTLDSVVAEARQANPMLRAARLRADASRARISRVGALPDPAFSFSLRNRPLDGFGTAEPMTMNSFQLQQRLPWPGKLGFAEERESRLAEASQLTALESEVVLVSRVKGVYLEIAFMDRALEIMRDTRELLREFLDVSNTLYAVGTGLQVDVLQAQVSVAGMTEDITAVEQHRLAMAARLNALLGRDARISIPDLELDTPGAALPTIDELVSMAENARPALQAAEAIVLAAESGVSAAGRAGYPDFTLSAEYSQRPEFTDMMSLSLGVSVPLWSGSGRGPAQEEARAVRAMQEAVYRDLVNETFARIAEAHAEADRARRLSNLYATSIVPQARAAVESSLSAYRVGQVDFMTLLQTELTVNRYEIETVRLAASYHAAVASLEALVGGPLEQTP